MKTISRECISLCSNMNTHCITGGHYQSRLIHKFFSSRKDAQAQRKYLIVYKSNTVNVLLI